MTYDTVGELTDFVADINIKIWHYQILRYSQINFKKCHTNLENATQRQYVPWHHATFYYAMIALTPNVKREMWLIFCLWSDSLLIDMMIQSSMIFLAERMSIDLSVEHCQFRVRKGNDRSRWIGWRPLCQINSGAGWKQIPFVYIFPLTYIIWIVAINVLVGK